MTKENINLLTGKFNLGITKSLSPLFSLAKIYVMYTGKNPNGSIISRESVERNIETLRNIPIVGEYIREDDNFKSHGGELTIEDEEIRLINTTVPIGVVPDSATFAWETIIDGYGEEREYLVVENAFIWNRDVKMVEALKSDSFGQSMEISVTDGTEMQDGFFSIDDFYFTALCVLGIDRDGAGYVQPAFDNANITTYSRNDEEFANSLGDMFKDFKLALDDMKNLVEEDNELKLEGLLEKYSITLEELAVKIENYENLEVEEIDKILSESDEKADETDTDTVDTDEENDDKKDEEITDEDEKSEGDETDEVDKVDEVDETDTDEVDEVDEGSEENIGEYEAQIALLEKENANLKSQVESLETKVTEYSRAEHERVCSEKIEEFKLGYKLTDEIVGGIDVHEFDSIESLETKLFEIVGRLANKEEIKETENFNRIKNKLEDSNKNKKVYSFENLFEKNKK